jgi:hypothetical protein
MAVVAQVRQAVAVAVLPVVAAWVVVSLQAEPEELKVAVPAQAATAAWVPAAPVPATIPMAAVVAVEQATMVEVVEKLPALILSIIAAAVVVGPLITTHLTSAL